MTDRLRCSSGLNRVIPKISPIIVMSVKLPKKIIQRAISVKRCNCQLCKPPVNHHLSVVKSKMQLWFFSSSHSQSVWVPWIEQVHSAKLLKTVFHRFIAGYFSSRCGKSSKHQSSAEAKLHHLHTDGAHFITQDASTFTCINTLLFGSTKLPFH